MPPEQSSPNAALPLTNVVETVDGEFVPSEEARKLCRRNKFLPPCVAVSGALYFTGFLLLPWMWCINVWLFWPDFRLGRDAVITRYTRRSAVGSAIATAILLPWMLTFMIGQEAVFGTRLFDALDAAKLDLVKWGLVF